MNCQNIRHVLDEHQLEQLTPDQRFAFDRHLSTCADCADDVALQRVLAEDPVGVPREGLLSELLGKAAGEIAAGQRASRSYRWQTLGGLAAAAALIVVVAIGVLGIDGDEMQTSADSALSNPVDNTASNQVGVPLAEFVEGIDFVSLPLASPVDTVRERVSAWLFFLWSCLHCYELESFLSEWSARPEAQSIDLIRIPVQWNPVAQLHARAFFTAEALGVADEVGAEFYRSIHEAGATLQTEDQIEALFVRLGVDSETFRQAFDSDSVLAEVDRAAQLARNLGIDSTPTIVVDGIYRTDPGMTGSPERMMRVVEWLGTER